MTFRPFRPLRLIRLVRPFRLLGLFGLLIISCTPPTASPPDLIPATVPASNLPTPTPFQPQTINSADPYLALTTPQAVPTFTPYPAQYVLPQDITAPIEIIPSFENNLTTYNPLTGLAVSDPTLLQRRPLAIKIGNSPDYVRPQSGLSMADVAFEYYIEWGDTRFIAIFYSNNVERVGPVRSGRFFDEHVARMYHSYLMFKGADPRELSYLTDSDLNPFLVSVGRARCVRLRVPERGCKPHANSASGPRTRTCAAAEHCARIPGVPIRNILCSAATVSVRNAPALEQRGRERMGSWPWHGLCGGVVVRHELVPEVTPPGKA